MTLDSKAAASRRSRRKQYVKRAFDLALAVPLLVFTSPVVLITAVLVRILLGRPVLFRQQRPGLRGRPFTILKFRTMTNEQDNNGQLLPDTQRLTRFGQFLRSTSLDEWPELLNVISGDMGLVGPRPLLMSYMPRYSPEQMRRHDVLPGITGWAQVNGRNALTWEEKFKLDTWYVDNWSMLLDLRILLLTFKHVLKRHGISNAQHATMPEFLGNSGCIEFYPTNCKERTCRNA